MRVIFKWWAILGIGISAAFTAALLSVGEWKPGILCLIIALWWLWDFVAGRIHERELREVIELLEKVKSEMKRETQC